MPVPSSYNDVTVNSTVRDFVGWAWYQHEFYTPKRWWTDERRVVLRFGSVHYTAVVVSCILNTGEDYYVGWDSIVHIATHHGLDVLGIEFW
jgi:hypothetical protein